MKLYSFFWLLVAFLIAHAGALAHNEIDDRKALEQQAQIERMLYEPEA